MWIERAALSLGFRQLLFCEFFSLNSLRNISVLDGKVVPGATFLLK